MTRLVQKPPTLAARSVPRLGLAVLVALLLATSAADAGLTTSACLAQKRVAWGTLRKCQATEEAKQLKGKPADLAKCQAKFQGALAKISLKATKTAIACRYGDTGGGTVTDYDTGLMWEKKNVGNMNDAYPWAAARQVFPEGYNHCPSDDGSTLGPCGSRYHDWRLPNIVELRGIIDLDPPGCGSVVPCINPIFGPTFAYGYWSSSYTSTSTEYAWYVQFRDGSTTSCLASCELLVRAVRTGL